MEFSGWPRAELAALVELDGPLLEKMLETD